MRLDRYIESRLACSARSVREMLAHRQVLLNGVAVAEGRGLISEFCRVEVAGDILQARTPVYVMFHKPPGCVSATRDHKNPTVLDLLNWPDKDQLHLAGRLDFNTTGLMLLTNDGRWSRLITQPQQKIPKTYWVKTKDEITAAQIDAFAQGIYFRFEDLWTSPAQIKPIDTHTAYLTIYEGRYHQIKRMFGVFNNEVTGLHRLAMGNIQLDTKLALGECRALTHAEIESVYLWRNIGS